LGIFFKKVKQTDAIIGFAAGIIGMVFVIYFTKIAWTWYTIIGVIFTIVTANISKIFTSQKT
jgi:Na+(H+)/acetate symporter ActP